VLLPVDIGGLLKFGDTLDNDKVTPAPRIGPLSGEVGFRRPRYDERCCTRRGGGEVQGAASRPRCGGDPDRAPIRLVSVKQIKIMSQ
jgi:hypothetical protein